MTKKLAFVFPGQGSQAMGMLAALAEQYPLVQTIFAQASEVLGFDAWQLSQTGSEERLNQTANTQPVLLTASYAVWRVWRELAGSLPDLVAGHSLGEYTALVCNGVLEFPIAVKLVQQRGEFMQQAVALGTGAMSAILGLDEAQVAAICQQAAEDEVVAPANINSVGQIVIAGHKQAVERANALAMAAGALKVVPLAVSVPSHCALMQTAAEKLAQQLQKISFNTPKIPLISNVNAQLETDPKRIKQNLIAQLTQPVRWLETIQTLAAQDVKIVVECGPGRVLTGLNKRIDKNLVYTSINDPENIATTKELLI